MKKITDAIGQSESFINFQEKLSRVARIDRPVLILGERGTGKELAAARLHFLSRRWEQPFIPLNCSALSASLIESELFGHDKGAFTGAEKQRLGRFEQADSGTLFLDEIGTIPLVAQEKILRAVEYGEFERVGGNSLIQVNTRVIAATNADLQAMVESGEFKADLLDRLAFEVLILPPLRERKEDIVLLADFFAARMLADLDIPGVPEFSREAISMLLDYQWPGNIRELKNVIERSVAHAESFYINSHNIIINPFQGWGSQKKSKSPKAEVQKIELSNPYENMPLKQARMELEKDMIMNTMQRCCFNRKKAAEELELTYDQLRGLIRKYYPDGLG